MGIIQSFVVKNRRFLKIPKPNDPEESNLVVMKLKHILSPVILQLCGLTLALIAFCYEKCKIKCVKQAEEIA